jgi:hypothetical protein
MNPTDFYPYFNDEKFNDFTITSLKVFILETRIKNQVRLGHIKCQKILLKLSYNMCKARPIKTVKN